MNKETLDLVKGLVEKLGTTADHLWGVLIKQAPISSACDCVAVFFIVVLSVLAIFKISNSSQHQEGKTKQLYFYEHDELAIGLTAVLFIIAFITIMAFIFSFNTIMAGFFNPEYWALKQIIHY
jgi:hypothetical protein